jgi:hypothetical protein
MIESFNIHTSHAAEEIFAALELHMNVQKYGSNWGA